MSSNECKMINIQLHETYLSRIGVDSHLPLAYRYAPIQYQGLNSLDIETKQFVEKLEKYFSLMQVQIFNWECQYRIFWKVQIL